MDNHGWRQDGHGGPGFSTSRWAAQPVCSACPQCGHSKGDIGPLSVWLMADKHMGQAISWAVAGGCWELACLRCGEVEGAGFAAGLWFVVLSAGGAGGVVSDKFSSGVVRSTASRWGTDMAARKRTRKIQN